MVRPSILKFFFFSFLPSFGFKHVVLRRLQNYIKFWQNLKLTGGEKSNCLTGYCLTCLGFLCSFVLGWCFWWGQQCISHVIMWAGTSTWVDGWCEGVLKWSIHVCYITSIMILASIMALISASRKQHGKGKLLGFVYASKGDLYLSMREESYVSIPSI